MKAARENKLRADKARVDGAWRVYDAICSLGYADMPIEHVAEITEARKAAWERYKRLGARLQPAGKGGKR